MTTADEKHTIVDLRKFLQATILDDMQGIKGFHYRSKTDCKDRKKEAERLYDLLGNMLYERLQGKLFED